MSIDSMDMDTAFPGDPKGMLDGTVVQPQKQILITKRKFLRSDKGWFDLDVCEIRRYGKGRRSSFEAALLWFRGF